MPDRPLTIAGYAAGASLAAITLVYVFGPTFFLDDDAAQSSRSARKKGVIGLINPANDCFINSVLQVLAGLPELRAFLIKEVHRRELDGDELYHDLSAALQQEKEHPSRTQVPEWKTVGLQRGLVTAGLKEVLDALNERPIYKKTISAQSFIRCVEQAFKTRISRTQQDAQEFLQVIVERIAEEYFAGRTVRRHARQGTLPEVGDRAEEQTPAEEDGRERAVGNKPFLVNNASAPAENTAGRGVEKDENCFPLQGKLESQVECLHCHYKPKPSSSSFLTLTLNVPHDSTSSTLNTCFDQLLKQEYIEDFKCEKCRLEHALQINAEQLSHTELLDEDRIALEADRAKLEQAIEEDPEKPPKDVKLPDITTAPKRKISRYTRISCFPRVLAVHLSRSVWDSYSSSSKNMAKVSFPESLPLGGLLDRKTYRLLGVVTHKGGHNSGHYETFRRQVLSPPFSTPASLGKEGIYSLRSTPAPSPKISATSSPLLDASGIGVITENGSEVEAADTPSISTVSTALSSTPTSTTASGSAASSTSQPHMSTLLDRRKQHPPFDSVPTPGLPTPPQSSSAITPAPQAAFSTPTLRPKTQSSIAGLRHRAKKNKGNDRWWRISDDKIKESKTSDVLSMQREVYMLFYEIVLAQPPL